MTPEELKISILQLAIQGKLVEQRPEEGTGEELYQQIHAENQRLIKAGTIKKDKPLPVITDDEKTFDIPEWWKWCRLGELGTLVRGITFPGTEKSREPLKGCIRCATTGSVQSSYNETADVFVPAKYIKNTMQWLENEDIMLSTANSKELVGKSCLWFGNDKMTFGGFLTVARFPDLLCRKYLYYAIQYLHKCGIFAKASTQTTNIANINNDILSKMLISLPPLAEQKRIVAKIEELLPCFDRYGQAWRKLEDFNKRFPTDIQKSILQMAIQGKLVEQRPEEGTGEELYRRIQAEKQRLIKAGTIKKEKLLPEITEDEKSFDIPESWKWVRLGDLLSVGGGKRLPIGSNLTTTQTKHIYIRVTDMQRNSVDMTDLHYITDDIYNRIRNYIITKNDLYIVIVGSTIGKVGSIPEQLNGMNLTENAARLTPFLVDKDYLLYTLKTEFLQRQFIDKTHQVGQPKLALMRLKTASVPIPPLAEQKRIVAKLEEILPQCEKLI